MKPQKLTLDQEEEEGLHLALLRLSKKIPAHELFFQINKLNHSQFSREEDFIVEGQFYDYFFLRYSAYSSIMKTKIEVIGNKSLKSVKKKQITELFSEEANQRVLMVEYPDTDYIIYATEEFNDFSLILLPEDSAFPIQNIMIEPDSEIFSLLQY